MAKKEFFAEVKWHEDDIRLVLEDEGLEPSNGAVATVREWMESHWFTGALIECGFDIIRSYVSEATREQAFADFIGDEVK